MTDVEHAIRRKTRRSFLVGGLSAAAGLAAWRWILTRREESGVNWPLRRVLETNEGLARDFFSPAKLARTYPKSEAVEPRVNGPIGIEEEFEPAAWKLQVDGMADDVEQASLSLADVQRLPRQEMTTELRCIEGWSHVVTWAGARFSEFAQQFAPEEDTPYVAMETPDRKYYVGLDMESAMHPQTLLCYEMNGRPLPLEHGGPLRLVVPVKYGIKNIKRIGRIAYAQSRPADYWAERGYDWYAGL